MRLRPATSHFPQEGLGFKEDSRTLWLGQSIEKSHLDLAFAVIDFLSSFIEVELTYNKLHIFKAHNLISFDVYMYTYKTISTIKIMNIYINLKSLLITPL